MTKGIFLPLLLIVGIIVTPIYIYNRTEQQKTTAAAFTPTLTAIAKDPSVPARTVIINNNSNSAILACLLKEARISHIPEGMISSIKDRCGIK